jgi:hypothetical protein
VSDFIQKAKDALGSSGAADEVIDQAADAAKNVAPDAADGTIDDVAQKAKDAL